MCSVPAVEQCACTQFTYNIAQFPVQGSGFRFELVSYNIAHFSYNSAILDVKLWLSGAVLE